jgi:hypothetical protein
VDGLSGAIVALIFLLHKKTGFLPVFLQSKDRSLVSLDSSYKGIRISM